jgi:hypothetical protein
VNGLLGLDITGKHICFGPRWGAPSIASSATASRGPVVGAEAYGAWGRRCRDRVIVLLDMTNRRRGPIDLLGGQSGADGGVQILRGGVEPDVGLRSIHGERRGDVSAWHLDIDVGDVNWLRSQ